MILELSQLPTVVQQQLIQAKTPVEIVSEGKVVATLNPAFETMAKKQDFEMPQQSIKKPSLYDIFANADPAVADIEFDLPPRTISNRPIAFEDE